MATLVAGRSRGENPRRALTTWVAVVPTLTVLNLTLGDLLAELPPVLRIL